MATAHKSRVLDMTQGDPFRLVLQFSMPLFCSNLLQQLYNLTDTALAGHLLGSAALAEIGATAALYGLIMNFAFGMNNGLALTVSRYFGAGDESGIRRAVGWMVTLSAAVLTHPLLRDWDMHGWLHGADFPTIDALNAARILTPPGRRQSRSCAAATK